MSWLASTCFDLDNTVSNFGNFEFEESFYKARMRSADHNLWTFCCFSNFDDVCLDASVWLWSLIRNLFGLRQKGFNFAQIQQCIPTLGLLDDASDDVALAVCVLLEFTITFYFANALTHDLTESHRRNTTEFVLIGCVVTLIDPVSVIINVVGDELHLEVLRIELNDDFFCGIWPLFVCRCKSLDEHLQECID